MAFAGQRGSSAVIIYDFLSYGPEQVMVAVGDVSGKGISAALLMLPSIPLSGPMSRSS